MKVGFVGLGLMGAPMSRNLLKAGHTVKAWNRTKSKVDEFVADGGEAASSPENAATDVDVVITIVTDSPDVLEVALGVDAVEVVDVCGRAGVLSAGACSHLGGGHLAPRAQWPG